jgi:eukaryotic-like serine/threonine-protein kinase
MGLSSGTRLGPYQVLAPVGAGGMGEVYRARDLRLGRDVAVKVLPESFARDPDLLQRFEQEARTLAALNHPSIVAVFDVGTHDGVPYLVSELLDGQTLREHLRAGSLPVRKALELMSQVAEGLAAAHDKGIIHRDLKPENIFITRDSRAKVLDFGLAKLVRTEGVQALTSAVTTVTAPGMVVGTAGYMSPEQVRGEEIDHRSDIFSYGTVLYEVLSGHRAFKGASNIECMNAILNSDPPEIAGAVNLSPAVDHILRRCLDKYGDRRFQSIKDIAFALEAISGTAGPVRQDSRPRREWRLTAVAAAILVGLAVVIWLVGFGRERREPAMFHQITFRSGSIQAARFASDGLGVIYSAQWEGDPPEIQSSRTGDIEFRSLGLPAGTIAAVSSQGGLAMLLGCEPFFVSDCGGTLAQVPAGGGAPRALLEHVHYADWSPAGDRLAVVVQDSSGHNRLEYPIGRVLFDSPGWITTPRISRDGKLIAFAYHDLTNDDRGKLAVVDTEGHVRFLTPELASVEGVAWAPSGQEIWVAASADVDKSAWSDTLYGINLKGEIRARARFPGIVRLHDVASDGRILLSREVFRKQMIGYFPGDRGEHPFSWLDWSVGAGISNDGRLLLFSEAGGAATDTFLPYLRPTDGSPPVRLGKGAAIALSPDGKWAAVNDVIANKLSLIPTGAGNARLLDSGAISQYDFPGWWSADGKTLSFVARERGRGLCVYSQSLAGGPPRQRSPEMRFIGMLRPHFAVSPDASLAAVIPAGASKIHLFDISGKDLGEVAGATENDVPALFSGDGHLLVGPRFGGWPLQFFALDLKTSKRELWKTLAPSDRAGFRADWDLRATPDLNYYVYSLTQATSELFVMSSSGRKP